MDLYVNESSHYLPQSVELFEAKVDSIYRYILYVL